MTNLKYLRMLIDEFGLPEGATHIWVGTLDFHPFHFERHVGDVHEEWDMDGTWNNMGEGAMMENRFEIPLEVIMDEYVKRAEKGKKMRWKVPKRPMHVLFKPQYYEDPKDIRFPIG